MSFPDVIPNSDLKYCKKEWTVVGFSFYEPHWVIPAELWVLSHDDPKIRVVASYRLRVPDMEWERVALT